MGTENLLDEKHITNAFVHIEGDKLEIISLILDQGFGVHHHFEVILDYDIALKSFLGNPLDQIALIGKTLDIDLQHGNDSGGAYEFRGVINNVYTEGREGKHGYLVIEGLSTTCLLERGKRLDIFTEMSLQQVFEEVTDDIKNNRLSKINKPVYNVPVNFLMQYYESDWEFLQRLAAISGETLFYTGRDLVFGEYKDWAATEVMYDREVTEIKFGSYLLPNSFTHYQYLPGKDEIIEQESSETIENSNNYLNLAAQKGKDLVKNRPVRIPSPLNVEDKGGLGEIAEKRKTETAAQTIYVKGTAKTSAPRIGRLLTILMPESMSTIGDLGTYRIVKVRHTIDEKHRYSCTFEGIPANLKYFPTPDLKQPVVNSLVATVIKNADPEGLGRVRVEFPFAQDRVSNAWMRVMTPNAGVSEAVRKNRGLVFVPEEGDQVMVGFEFGDPNRPYVMGSMFHGQNAEGGKEKNHIKSIITQSGHTIEFDDAKDTLGITIKDINENVIHVDTANDNILIKSNKNITIKAAENMNFKAKNIAIEAEENLTAQIGKDVITKATGNLDVKAQSGIVLLEEKLSVQAKEIGMQGENVVQDASNSLMLKGASKAKLQGGKVEIQGSSNKLEMA